MGVGSAGRGVAVGGGEVGWSVGGREVGWSVGGGEVGRSVGGTWVALGRTVGARVVGTDVTPGLGLLVGVLVAVDKRSGSPEAGVYIIHVGVCISALFVCAASMRISGVSDRTAALILSLK